MRLCLLLSPAVLIADCPQVAVAPPPIPDCPDCGDVAVLIDEIKLETLGWRVVMIVENTGLSTTPGCWTDVYLDRTSPPGPGDLSQYYIWTPALNPSEAVTLEVDVPAGSWVDVKVDSTERIDEVSETNNLDFMAN